MAVPTKARDAAPTITNFNIESPAATDDKSRTNLTLLRAQQTDSRASNSAIFFDECCGNGTQLCSLFFHEKLSYLGSLLHHKAPQPSRLQLRLDGPKPSSCTLPRRTTFCGLGRDPLVRRDFPFLADPRFEPWCPHRIFQ